MRDLARAGRQRGRWSGYRTAIPDWFRAYVDLEADASEIRWYQPEVVPGILQTEHYIRAMNATAHPRITDEAVNKQVEVRLERQVILDQPDTTLNEHRAAIVEQLAAAESLTSDNARMEQARNKLVDAEKRIRRLQQAIEAGPNPAALVDPLNRAEQERQAAHADLDRIPARYVLSYADIAVMINELGDVGQALDRADPTGLEDLYSALRLEMVYDASAKTVN
ncbi:MAG: Scr1 family TA system antitoxin-like transcriptional regulator, partial [Pseudonocardiaceae bacterium]